VNTDAGPFEAVDRIVGRGGENKGPQRLERRTEHGRASGTAAGAFT
jgi:hypothetical protein